MADKVEYFVHHNVWLAQHLTTMVEVGCSDPMQGLMDVAVLFKNQGGFGNYGTLECFRYVNGVKAERQWVITID